MTKFMSTAGELIRETGKCEGSHIVLRGLIHSPQLNRKFSGFWQSWDIKPKPTLRWTALNTQSERWAVLLRKRYRDHRARTVPTESTWLLVRSESSSSGTIIASLKGRVVWFPHAARSSKSADTHSSPRPRPFSSANEAPRQKITTPLAARTLTITGKRPKSQQVGPFRGRGAQVTGCATPHTWHRQLVYAKQEGKAAPEHP